MKITVKTIKNESFPVEVINEGTVLDLKNEISKAYRSIPIDNIKVIFEGKILENDRSLQSYSIKDNCNVVIVIGKSKSNQSTKNEINNQQDNTNTTSNTSNTSKIDNPLRITDDSNKSQDISINKDAQKISQENNLLPEITENFYDPTKLQQIINDPNFLTNIMMIGRMLHNRTPNNELFEDTKIELTESEKQDIDSLIDMGFDESDVIQYYLVCGKDKNLAADMMMNDILNDNTSSKK